MVHGTIAIDLARCKGCNLCVTFCPQHIIALDTTHLNAKGYHPAILNDPQQECTGCAICSVVCPDVCIMVLREPAVSRRVTQEGNHV